MQRQPTPVLDPNRKGHFLRREQAFGESTTLPRDALVDLSDLPSNVGDPKKEEARKRAKRDVDINKALEKEDHPKAEENLEGKTKKTELELLEERDENELTEEEEDRMYELRRLRAQKNMNNEVREAEQAELKKADEEIAHLKTLLKPKPKKLPKGYIA